MIVFCDFDNTFLDVEADDHIVRGVAELLDGLLK